MEESIQIESSPGVGHEVLVDTEGKRNRRDVLEGGASKGRMAPRGQDSSATKQSSTGETSRLKR